MTDTTAGDLPPEALAGLRVVDLTTVIMGPYATVTLADLGADVIKVEPLAGDMSRHIGSRRNPGMSALTMNLQRNKRSIAADLSTDAGRAVLDELVRHADVLVTNLRPQSRDRLGITWDRLRDINPGLIFCTAQAYGSGTEQENFPAYDDIVQAASGMTRLAERVDGSPRFAPYVVADKVVGLYIVTAILAAVVHKKSTGNGQSIDVPMIDSMIAFNLVEHFGGNTFEPPAGEFGWARVLVPERVPHPTADGWVCIMPYSDANWRDFFKLAGLEELADDARYTSVDDRHRHMGELLSMIRDVTTRHTTAEWLSLCAAHNLPASDLLDLADAHTDPYVLSQELLLERAHPTEGQYYSTRTPFAMSQTPVGFKHHAPHLGEHTERILAEIGFSESEIQALLTTGDVAGPGGS
ncbi:CaiB/BaiF CoA transferase family protein [Aeromicrobium sp. CF4.19]|uniref:CaiB/BaiF CoA transferase family protein n=1 Tax=Aeromicrobium sp. CF4.19 TaxID=3373082 RepID=UPI003EE54B5D